MSASARVTLAFADGEHDFRLSIGRLRELQEKTGAGPYAIFRRLNDGSWMVDDVRETIRLGLIGGGLEPAKALALTTRYVDERPLAENVANASAILLAAVIGVPEDPVGKTEPGEAETEATSASPSPASMAPEPSSDGQPGRSMN